MTVYDQELATLKKKLKNRRKQLHWSQAVAAKKAGIPWISYQRLESKGYTFEIDTLIKVMVALDISFDSLKAKSPGVLKVVDVLDIDFNKPIDVSAINRKSPFE